MSIVLPASPSSPALLLRPWRHDDAAALLYAHEDESMRRWLTTVVDDEAQALLWIAARQDDWQARRRFALAAFELHGIDTTLVGNVVVTPRATGPAVAEVGYWTTAAARGRGIATRLLGHVSGWAFSHTPELQRLELLHQVDNVASCRVAGKGGYPLERTMVPHPPEYPLEGHLHVRTRDGSRAAA